MASIKWPKKEMKYLKIPLYNQVVWFVADEAVYKQASDYLNMEDIGRSAGVTVTASNQEGNRIYLIGIFDGSLSTLVHEIFHCVDAISRDLGWNMSEARGEPAAYLAGFLYDGLGKFLLDDNEAKLFKHADKVCAVPEQSPPEKDEVSTNSRKKL